MSLSLAVFAQVCYFRLTFCDAPLLKRCFYYSKNPLRLAILVNLTGCTVYVPTVPSTPLIEKGQQEISAGIRSVSSLEATAAWSPAAHVLLSGEAAIQYFKDQQVKNSVSVSNAESHRQIGMGVGIYTLSKAVKPLYMAAVIGIGAAKADVHEVHIIGPNDRFQARYWRYYAQFYLAQPGPRLTWGASVRGTWVDYQQLLREGQPVQPLARFYVEPHLFVRVGTGPVQGYATLGISLPTSQDAASDQSAKSVLAPSSALVGVGVVLRPYLLQQRDR